MTADRSSGPATVVTPHSSKRGWLTARASANASSMSSPISVSSKIGTRTAAARNGAIRTTRKKEVSSRRIIKEAHRDGARCYGAGGQAGSLSYMLLRKLRHGLDKL